MVDGLFGSPALSKMQKYWDEFIAHIHSAKISRAAWQTGNTVQLTRHVGFQLM